MGMDMRLILADDEPVITGGIQKLIDWKSLGIEIVGVYEDGISAFEGILRLRPQVALLDISMPGMTGIEILKECQSLEVETKIVFISGFQDFSYAREAVKYGAVDYLLKPLVREELTGALEKCAAALGNSAEWMETRSEGRSGQESGVGGPVPAEADQGRQIRLEETDYYPAAVLFETKQRDEKTDRLLRFSVGSFLENALETKKAGIIFSRGEDIVIVLKCPRGSEDGEKECEETLDALAGGIEQATGLRLLFVLGRRAESMSHIRAAWQECLTMRGYAFFAGRLPTRVIRVGEPAFGRKREGDAKRLEQVRDALAEAVANRDHAAFEGCFEQLERLVCRISAGKKEDACFYFCAVLRVVEERLLALGIPDTRTDIQTHLGQARNACSYEELTRYFRGVLEGYMDSVRDTSQSSDLKNFLKAREYIELNYAQELTLQILADEIHMNPYYFSAFFKKNAGENFKAYVNRVRLEHAVSMLVTTDKKTAQIAMETGFSDARSFSENFQKLYHETPNEYRKRIRGKKTD